MTRRKKKPVVASPEAMKISCTHCMKSSFLKCSRCKEVFYCSENCQKNNWVKHKESCIDKTREQKLSGDHSSNKGGEKCDCCGKSGIKLNKCSKCHKVKYCSEKCQKSEWPKHKDVCEKNSIPSADGSSSQTTGEEKCDCCGKSGIKLSQCSKCHKVKYCSKKCQKSKWLKHKNVCEKNSIPSADGSSSQTIGGEKCDCCGKSGIKLSKCSKCHKVKYCSEKCQKSEWPKHKDMCEKNSIPSADGSSSKTTGAEKCNFCGKSGIKLSKCSKCHEAKYCSKICQKSEWPKHKKNCARNPKNLAQGTCVRCFAGCKGDSKYCHLCIWNILFSVSTKVPARIFSIASVSFPEFQLITYFKDIQRQNILFYFVPNYQVCVALMCERGGHWFRPSMILRDEEGIEFHLIFYLEENDPSFPWYKFKPGNYICITFPNVHYFADGTIGFRIEDTDKVKIIE